ncbi:succinyldiaminopimelate transaminase [Nocardioides sp. TF02-7]|uniref:succinyldiaminopimelate transaminase n=1 Tax=Nocardioides sp. TF02-7 TaxID=2917724 RepID=UPI001F06DFE9|nr:succinyldiaminopimelate transaminase [Nocardioides sp. TF02-7]UMG94854.1 succinyldiaminopimelate transaminase [Nocardioides sp. TF02-7]
MPRYYGARLDAYRRTAAAHPDGPVDVSIGSPVDDTAAAAQQALAAAGSARGYPATAGTSELREAVVGWLTRVAGASGVTEEMVLPVLGAKEFVAGAPLQLGLAPGDVVAVPELAYPTYGVGVALAGCTVTTYATPRDLVRSDARPALVWLNSPSNPDGAVWSPEETAELVAWARSAGTLVVSDECYLEFGWEDQPVSVLDPRVHGGDLTGLLAVHSESKRSNAAGYRLATVSGDAALVRELLDIRRNVGLIMPTPQQRVLTALVADDEHVRRQREVYARRRALLRGALEGAGFVIARSTGGLYLWAALADGTPDPAAHLAARGILAVPGRPTAPRGRGFVRVALTVNDRDVQRVVDRLAEG